MSVALWIAAAYVAGVMGCLFGQWVENETLKARREAQERRVVEFLVRACQPRTGGWDSAWWIYLEGVLLAQELAESSPDLATLLLREALKNPEHSCSSACLPGAHALFALAA